MGKNKGAMATGSNTDLPGECFHISLCIKQSPIQFKLVHHLHWSTVKLVKKTYPNVTPACLHCHEAPATVAHMFWDFGIFEDFLSKPCHFCAEKNNTVHTSSFSRSLFLELMVPAAQPKTIAFASLLA